MGAYLIGRTVTADGHCRPLAIALINDRGGITVDGVIHDTRGIRLLFSYTHSYFHVSTDHIMELVAFLHPCCPIVAWRNSLSLWGSTDTAKPNCTVTWHGTRMPAGTSSRSRRAHRVWSWWCSTCRPTTWFSKSSATVSPNRSARRAGKSLPSTTISSATTARAVCRTPSHSSTSASIVAVSTPN
jgi:hypothetical protein